MLSDSLAILRFINNYRALYKYSPPLKQVRLVAQYRSLSGLMYHLKKLVDSGYLNWNKESWITLYLTDKGITAIERGDELTVLARRGPKQAKADN